MPAGSPRRSGRGRRGDDLHQPARRRPGPRRARRSAGGPGRPVATSAAAERCRGHGGHPNARGRLARGSRTGQGALRADRRPARTLALARLDPRAHGWCGRHGHRRPAHRGRSLRPRDPGSPARRGPAVRGAPEGLRRTRSAGGRPGDGSPAGDVRRPAGAHDPAHAVAVAVGGGRGLPHRRRRPRLGRHRRPPGPTTRGPAHPRVLSHGGRVAPVAGISRHARHGPAVRGRALRVRGGRRRSSAQYALLRARRPAARLPGGLLGPARRDGPAGAAARGRAAAGQPGLGGLEPGHRHHHLVAPGLHRLRPRSGPRPDAARGAPRPPPARGRARHGPGGPTAAR